MSRRPTNAQLVWCAGGATAGATAGLGIGLLAGHQFDAAWFGSVGAWSQSVVTVAAVGWAVHTFRVEQATRRQGEERRAREQAAERREEQERAATAAPAEERRLINEASQVVVETYGRGAQLAGSAGQWLLFTVLLRVINGTANTITFVSVGLRPEVRFTDRPPDSHSSLAPHETAECEPEVEGLVVSLAEVSTRRLISCTPTVQFQLEGQWWSRMGVNPLPESA